MDSGWGWVHFFKMMADNIDEELMNTPVHHRPSAPFVVSRVKLILNDFRTREEYMCLPEVRAIVDRAQTLLGRIESNWVLILPSDLLRIWRRASTDPSTAGGVSILLGVPIGIYMNRKMCHNDGKRKGRRNLSSSKGKYPQKHQT